MRINLRWLRGRLVIFSTEEPWASWGFSIFQPSTLWLCQNSYGKSPFIVDFPIKNGDFPIKNGDFPIKNDDFPIKNDDFPIKNGDFP